jgi:hypothetical protein
VKFSLRAELTNKEILDLVKSGVNETEIISKIESANSIEFDLSVEKMKELLDNGVSNNIIGGMIKKQAEKPKQ